MALIHCRPALGSLAASSRLNRAFFFNVRRGLASLKPLPSLFAPLDTFAERHIGPDDAEASKMLNQLGYESMDAFVAETVPPKIRVSVQSVDNTSIPVYSESQLHARAKQLAGQNKPFKSYIGMGYHCAVVPPVILRNVGSVIFSFPLSCLTPKKNLVQVMENPAWYTPYTPYQPEIAQGNCRTIFCVLRPLLRIAITCRSPRIAYQLSDYGHVAD